MSALATTDDAYFSRSQIETIKSVLCPGITDGELSLFREVCRSTGLNPFAKQIYPIKRPALDEESGKYIPKLTIQTGIDGYRLIAERTGKYLGQQQPMWCGADGKWVEVWTLSEPPVAARAAVYRQGFAEPMVRIARWSAYAQTKKGGSLTRMWLTMGPEQLAKCAEAIALRAAFPQELSGMYTRDEMDQAENEVVVEVPKRALPPVAATVSEKPLVFVWETHPLNGTPVVDAPPVVLTAYLQELARSVDDPANARFRDRVIAHRERVEAVLEAKLQAQLSELGTPPMKLADQRLGVDRDNDPDSWGLHEPPDDVVLPDE